MTREEFVAKRLEWLESRKAELIEAAQTEETADGIESRSAELEGIQSEIDQIKALQEERSDLNPDIEERGFDPMQTFDITKTEERKMERFDIASAEYRDAWFKNILGRDTTAEERTAITNASAVIPTMTLDKIYGKLEENRLFAEIAPTRFPGYVTVPLMNTVDDASWLSMGTASTDSPDAVTTVSLAAHKLIKTVEVNADMANMAIPAFEAWLVDQIVSKMRRAICAAAIVGTGTNEPTGIKSVATSAGTSISYDNILKAMASVNAAYHDRAVWVCSEGTFFNSIMGLKDSNQRPLVYQGVQGIEGEPAYMLLGHRVILESACDEEAANLLVFGNFREGYAANFGKDIEISKDDSVGFRTGSTVFRGLALYDGAPAANGAFSIITVAHA